MAGVGALLDEVCGADDAGFAELLAGAADVHVEGAGVDAEHLGEILFVDPALLGLGLLRVFLAEAGEPLVMGVGLEEAGIRGVDSFEGERVRIGTDLFGPRPS